jgi:SAM-dependent methyltransferase
LIDTNSPQSNDANARQVHSETGAGWEILARAGYSGEIDEDIEFIRSGGVNLMDTEQRLLKDLDQWCHCAIHLQCSGGKDLLSLWNMGAKKLIGIDISGTLIGYARQKSEALGAPATWYCCDVLDTPHELDGSADLVYTGRGALMWMTDLTAWAHVVERLLGPGGTVLVFEGHPLDNLWQREAKDFRLRPGGISYFPTHPNENPGFPSSAVIRETNDDRERPKMLERCWRPGQVLNALASVGLEYVHFDEYPDLFWNQFYEMPQETAHRLPHTYSVMMRKRSSSWPVKHAEGGSR